MRLLEYEAKQILGNAGLPVPPGLVMRQDESLEARITFPVVVKSQVPVGGRGKAGGVVIVETIEELQTATDTLFGLDIKGFTPQSLLLEPKLAIADERYLSILLNRETASIQLVAHKDGGVEVESNTGFYREDITPESIPVLSRKVAELFGEENETAIQDIVTNLYECFTANDALLMEINPLVRIQSGAYVCADAKIELDDAARFRHKDWNFEEKRLDANFVTLDENGEVATIANGAGLAMATVDAVAGAGMKPANFLDVGGGANKESVLKAFNRIMEYKNVRAIVINIFAGITRCDEVARAIIAAREEIDSLPPLFIRLAGTNFEEAAVLLKEKDIATLATLEACLDAANEQISKAEVN